MSSIGRHVSKLAGYAPALPTPFGADGDIDIPAFERLCDLQLAHGATALIVCGTTGEAPTLIPEEHRLLIQIAAAQTRGRIPALDGLRTDEHLGDFVLIEQLLELAVRNGLDLCVLYS